MEIVTNNAIGVKSGFEDIVPLHVKSKNWIIYSYNHIRIRPQEIQEINLPYRTLRKDVYYHFELSPTLCNKGICVLSHNLNKESGISQLTFYVKNHNIDMMAEKDYLTAVMGSDKIIDIRPGTDFGEIYCSPLISS